MKLLGSFTPEATYTVTAFSVSEGALGMAVEHVLDRHREKTATRDLGLPFLRVEKDLDGIWRGAWYSEELKR